jgi:multiple sugar transport system substrate-binding protein
MTLRVALVGGPMYDGLYRMLDGQDVEVVVHADHPTLNRAVAELLEGGERLDVISTHAKYTPSQARWLRPLDTLIDPGVIAPLAAQAVDLCRFDGALLAVPRNIDVRVLWANRRLVAGRPVPATWNDLASSALVFGFPGRESGLFGTFFEIVTVHGGSLFDVALRPTLETRLARGAVETLVRLAQRGPSELPNWHYDQVDAALGDGRVALAAAWPGATSALRSSPQGRELEPYPYLCGPIGLRSYAGVHAWAIPRTCADLERAVRLVERLCSAEANEMEAASGSVCAHAGVFGAIRGSDEIDARRLEITRRTIADGMITYPPLVRFPKIEDAGWGALHRALRGEIEAGAALTEMQKAAEQVLADAEARNRQ